MVFKFVIWCVFLPVCSPSKIEVGAFWVLLRRDLEMAGSIFTDVSLLSALDGRINWLFLLCIRLRSSLLFLENPKGLEEWFRSYNGDADYFPFKITFYPLISFLLIFRSLNRLEGEEPSTTYLSEIFCWSITMFGIIY